MQHFLVIAKRTFKPQSAFPFLVIWKSYLTAANVNYERMVEKRLTKYSFLMTRLAGIYYVFGDIKIGKKIEYFVFCLAKKNCSNYIEKVEKNGELFNNNKKGIKN